MKSLKVFQFLFVLNALLQLLGLWYALPLLVFITKPLIVLILLAMLWYSSRLEGKFKKRIFIGLIFALWGDMLLMYQHLDTWFFIAGLICFFINHIYYIRAFTLDHKSNPSARNPYFVFVLIALAIIGGGFFFYVQPHLGAMRFPVLMYTIIITMMAITAQNRLNKVNGSSYMYILLGALCFVLSDAILAYNKFVSTVEYASIAIMLSYIIAQYCITLGSIKRILLVKRTEI